MANRYLLKKFETSTENEKNEGLSWYKDAQLYCQHTGVFYGVPMEIVAAIVSVLSPRNKWDRNKKDADTLLGHKAQGLSIEDFSVCTFTGNKTKAWNLLDQVDKFDPDEFFKGLKTRCFWDNIVYDKSTRVTIDTWAARAAYNTGPSWSRSLPKSEYKALEKQYVTSAAEVGETPKDFQAVVWVTTRNNLLKK